MIKFDDNIVSPRDELAWFASNMEEQLRTNDHKTGWEDLSTKWLLNRLKQEIVELERALRSEPPAGIVAECADVANFAMMIAHVTALTIERR